MRIIFTKNSWEDYTSWLHEDKKMLKKINNLTHIAVNRN
jgi:Txe/YoeB family toxin of Txe-Axe toxin-antitoxin module